jgi:hypothetical protein
MKTSKKSQIFLLIGVGEIVLGDRFQIPGSRVDFQHAKVGNAHTGIWNMNPDIWRLKPHFPNKTTSVAPNPLKIQTSLPYFFYFLSGHVSK